MTRKLKSLAAALIGLPLVVLVAGLSSIEQLCACTTAEENFQFKVHVSPTKSDVLPFREGPTLPNPSRGG